MGTQPVPGLLEGVPFSTAYLDHKGRMLRLTLAEDEGYRLPLHLKDISPHLIEATLAQEDRYFFMHPGVNPFSLLRGAWETYINQGRRMGGSTITMQLVRLRDKKGTRTLWGKARQIAKAIALDAKYSKEDILEAYLNLAPYGGNIYGIEAAAQIYFHISAECLTKEQAQALAVIPQNPKARAPFEKENFAWKTARSRLDPNTPPLPTYGRADLPFEAPRFLEGLARRPGPITTTLDLPTQNLLEDVLRTYIKAQQNKGLDNGAAILIHVPTMDVRALVGSAYPGREDMQGWVDMTRARRSPGSTLKPFIYALALEQGLIHPGTLLEDIPLAFAAWQPGNFDKLFMGVAPAREALALSRNLPAIALAARLHDPDIYTFLQDAGADFPKSAQHYGLSIAIGGAEVDMRTLARFYALLAAGGVVQDLRFYKDEIKKSHPKRLLSQEASFLALQMLERKRPDTPNLFATPKKMLPVYWKTGTSSKFRDAWTAGAFGPYVLVVWVGHADGHSNPALLGNEVAQPLFFAMVGALEGYEKLHDTLGPAMTYTHLTRVDGEWFIPGLSPFAPPPAPLLKIISPRSGVSYVWHASSGADPILLKAAPIQDRPVHWFVDGRYLGSHKGPLLWMPQPGQHTIRVTDGKGGADSQKISVVIVP